MADNFKPGDTARRRRSNLNNQSYLVGSDPFVVQSVKPGTFSDEMVAIDKNGQEHYFSSLEVVIQEDRIIPAAEKGGEVRTTSSTGGQKGVKPEAYALIPWEAMDEVARVYNEGAKKYAAHNWRNGYEWSKSFSAACRHLFAFWRGEDRDPELGTLHLANAAFHILGMITFALDREKYGEHDDRYTK